MYATITSRLSTPAIKMAAATVPRISLRQMSTEAGSTTAADAKGGLWTSLSPKTRRNIKIGAAVGVAADAVLYYEYANGMLPFQTGSKGGN